MTQLCTAHDKTFWPRLSWPKFNSMQDKENVLVVLPIVGFTDWKLNLFLDMEELISMPVLKEASRELENTLPHLVLPPLRFVLGFGETSCFSVDPETAHNTLKEIVISIQESGFRKVIFYNSSPWNEDLLNVAARDIRIELGMQMFCIDLAGIDLDLMEGRSSTREDCRTLAVNDPSDKAAQILESSSRKLINLLKEIAGRKSLANDGAILPKRKSEG